MVIVLASATACSAGGGTPPPLKATADVTVTAAAGASVRLAGGATLVIPPGAVTGHGRLIARTGAPPAGTHLSFTGLPAAARPLFAPAGGLVRFELTSTRLVRPAALTLPVDPAALAPAGAAASSPGAAWLAFYDTAAQRWQRVDSRYDPATHSVSAQVTHLSVWAAFTFAWQQIGAVLRQALSSLLSERTAPTPCPGVDQVVISSSGGSDGPVRGCASQDGSGQLTVTVTSNRGYAMVVPTPSGVTPAPPQYTGVHEFLRTTPNAIRTLGGEYLAPASSLAYTMPMYGSRITFDAAASVKTYVLDLGILVSTTILDVRTAGLGSCIMDNVANSGPLPLTAAPGLLIECLPIIGGATKEFWTAFGDFVTALAFARQYVGAVLDLNGDAQSGFRGTVQVTRPSLPLPDFYFQSAVVPEALYVHPVSPKTLGIDNHDWITVESVSSWTASDMIMTGILHYDACQPNCAAGPEVTVPVQVTASAPQTCTVQIGEPGSTSSQQAYVYGDINVVALSGSPPSFLVGTSVLQVCSS